MKTVRTVIAALAAGSALAAGAGAFAQDTSKPDAQPKPEAKHPHRGMQGQGGCHDMGVRRGQHDHS